MKVLFVGPYPPPFGGVQTHLVSLREYLRRQGIDSHVINITRTRRPAADGVYYPSSATEVLRLLWQLDYDIIHVHAGGQLTLRVLGLLLTCSLMRHVVTAFTFHSGGYPGSPEGQRASRRSIQAFVLRRLDALIGVNQELVNLFSRLGVAPGRCHLIPPFSLIGDGAGRAEAELSTEVESFLASHAPVLISVGLLEPEYDLPLQVSTFARVRAEYPSAGLLIIGSGSREGQLRTLIAQQSYSEHVLLAGDVAHHSTLSAIARADCLLRTTHYDGDAISVREALQLGTPVIATRTALRPPGVLLIPIGDADGLVAAVTAVLRGECRLQAKGPNDQALTGHEENLAAVVQLYQSILHRRARA